MIIDPILDALKLILQACAQRVGHFAGVALQAVEDLRCESDNLTGDWQWQSPIEFTDQQQTLLKVLLVLLLVVGVLIAWSWSVYGELITEQFVRPRTQKEIEEFESIQAELKLPKEHKPI